MAWGEALKSKIVVHQNESVNLDGHTIVRGLMISKRRIKELEDEVGGKLIPDYKNDLLHVLDEIAEVVRLKNGGKHTPQRTIETPDGRYVHRPLETDPGVLWYQLGINFKLKQETIPIGGFKKMWFEKPLTIAINRSKKPTGALLLP